MTNPNYKPQKTPREVVTPEYVKQCLKYDSKTGTLTWKNRPKMHFPTERGWAIFHASYAGKETGCLDHKGYLVVLIGGRPYFSHRLAWAIAKGKWPDEMIDHVNGDRSDNRICNLREASRSENLMNSTLRKDNTSGVKGVILRHGKWCVEIKVAKKRHRVGYFDSLEEAKAAVEAARITLHKDFTNHG